MDLFTLVAKLTMDSSEYEKGITKSKQSFMGLANTVSAKAVAVGTMVAHGVEKAASSLLKFGANAVQASADIEAEIALYHQVFGELESAATGALESISQDTNILSTRLRGIGTSAFMQFKGAGVDAGNAISMMDKYTRLAADAAAAYNISIEEADVKLRSFLRGNTEAGDSIGLFTSESQRNERAVAAYGQKWQKLTEAQKQMLMLNIVDEIYQQQEIIGQAAREGHEWENVIGNLKEAFTEFSGTVGGPFREALIPVIEKLKDFLVDETVTLRFGMIASSIGELAGKAFDGAINFIDGLIRWSNGEEPGEGYQIIADIFSAVGNVATAAYNGAKGVVDTLINFGGSSTDALSQAGEFFSDIKTLTESDGFKTIVSVLGGALAIILGLNSPLVLVGAAIATIATNWESVKDWAEKAWAAFQNFVNPIKVNLDAPTWEEVKEPLAEKIDAIIEGIKGIANWTLGAFGLPDVDSIISSIQTWWEGQGDNTYERIKKVLSWTLGEFVVPSAEAVAALMSSWWSESGQGAVQGVLDWTFGELFMPAWADLVYGIRDWWVEDIKPKIKELAEWNIGDVQFPSWEEIYEKATAWWNSIKDLISEIFTINIKAKIGDTSYTGSGTAGTAAEGIDVMTSSSLKAPGKAVGLDYVPYNNFFARLHEGEAVLTKAEASQWRSGGSVQTIDYSAIGSAVGSAVREALSGVGVYMGADRVGDLVTERVSRNIARDARNRRYQPV